jgi:predicted N-acyltransferase
MPNKLPILIASFHSSINAINRERWNTLCGTNYPFLRHEFFSAMENSGCTSKKTGWQPYHLTLTDASTTKIIAVMPLYLKHHSYGEYVFDWAWADAYQRHGLPYYPKLLNAIPFTPARGERWGIDNKFEEQEILSIIQQAITQEVKTKQLSSCHILFVNPEKEKMISHDQWQTRVGYQYHWFNQGFTCFDDFLATMSSRKRKNIIKEREKIQFQKITLVTKTGNEITAEEWQEFFMFYQSTYYKRSGHQGYLSAEFFTAIAKNLAEHIVMVQAYTSEQSSDGNLEFVAAALCFKDKETLYGRYWGCKENYDALHFEACYYQGIEYAIKHKLTRFDPGAQGEHKIQRGFAPIRTFSSHWIENKEFSQAITRFLGEEKKGVDQHIEEATKLLPFKKSPPKEEN